MINEIWLIHPNSAMTTAFEVRFAGLPGVRVIQDRFENLPPHDAFVTAGNAYGMMTAGIDAAVARFFGPELVERVQDRILNDYLGEQPVGTAFIVPTGHAERPWLVHAPTMRTPCSIEKTDKVYSATWAAILAIEAWNRVNPQNRLGTVAFPAMGTGFGQVPYDEAARQMAAAWRHYWNPPARLPLDWDFVANRERAISWDGASLRC